MKGLDRLLLIFFSLFIAILSMVTFFVSLGWTIPLELLNESFNTVNNRWIIGVSSVVIFIFTVNFILSHIISRSVTHTKVHSNDFGEINITIPAVESLVKKAAHQIIGVREVKPFIKCTPKGIAVFMKAMIQPGTVIPESTQELQATVKKYLEQTAGLEVVETKVLVTNISQDGKGRVD